MLDPIADMLTRIRNAQAAGHPVVSVRASKLKQVVADILKQEGFIENVEVGGEDRRGELVIRLKYTAVSPTRKDPAISEIVRVSKEGRRVYVKRHDIRKIKNGYGLAILSTSQGVMTGTEAYRRGLGGEYICKVW